MEPVTSTAGERLRAAEQLLYRHVLVYRVRLMVGAGAAGHRRDTSLVY